MQISERKLEANRANAQLSTGPANPATKAKVSQNATKHGLTGRFHVIEGESQRAFDEMLERYIQVEQPADDAERDLVCNMARHLWLADRALRLQDGCFLVQPRTPERIEAGLEGIAVRNELDKFVRYHAAQDRAYHRAAAALAKRRKERIAAARGIDSQKRAEAAEIRTEAREMRAAARENRTEKQENRRQERHQLAVAMDTKKLECLEADVITHCDKAARILHRNMAA